MNGEVRSCPRCGYPMSKQQKGNNLVTASGMAINSKKNLIWVCTNPRCSVISNC